VDRREQRDRPRLRGRLFQGPGCHAQDLLRRNERQQLDETLLRCSTDATVGAPGPAAPAQRIGIPDLSKFKNQIEIKITKDGLRIELIEQAEGLFFDIGSARLKPDAMQLLRLIASRIGTFPNDVVIEGHTDSRPYTRTGYNNWDLSTDRANSARRMIEEGGIRERQITSINGYADRRLKNPDKPLDYSNRRVTILVAFSASLSSAPKAIAPAAAPLVQKPVIVGRN
jgi:flagellar motor protein MotB